MLGLFEGFHALHLLFDHVHQAADDGQHGLARSLCLDGLVQVGALCELFEALVLWCILVENVGGPIGQDAKGWHLRLKPQPRVSFGTFVLKPSIWC